jgi:hypothetical protein
MLRPTGPSVRGCLRDSVICAFGLWILGSVGCDREDLFSGPAGGTLVPPPPPPPPSDCSPVPTTNELRGKLFVNEVMVFNESVLADHSGSNSTTTPMPR